MRDLPGDMRLQIEIAPPLSDDAIQKLQVSCRLPIPASLRRFWKEASGHCNCTYRWNNIPERFQTQLELAFPDWSLPGIWGGPELESAESCVKLADAFLEWADRFRDEYPKDSRYHEYSLPLVPVGDGDYAGLYVRDNQDNPPVVYLCHDGCGASGEMAPNLGTFLDSWERLNYIGIHFLTSFIDRRTDRLDPDGFPDELSALRALFRAEVISGLKSTPRFKNAHDWETSTEPEMMLHWLNDHGKLDKQQVRRFACACCRRVWDRLRPLSRRAVEVAERIADGQASASDLEAARAALIGGNQGNQLSQDVLAFPGMEGSENTRSPAEPDNEQLTAAVVNEIQRMQKDREEQWKFIEAEGPMRGAALCALDASYFASWEITKHMDEPELSWKKKVHADLVRKFFGNPLE